MGSDWPDWVRWRPRTAPRLSATPIERGTWSPSRDRPRPLQVERLAELDLADDVRPAEHTDETPVFEDRQLLEVTPEHGLQRLGQRDIGSHGGDARTTTHHVGHAGGGALLRRHRLDVAEGDHPHEAV